MMVWQDDLNEGTCSSSNLSDSIATMDHDVVSWPCDWFNPHSVVCIALHCRALSREVENARSFRLVFFFLFSGYYSKLQHKPPSENESIRLCRRCHRKRGGIENAKERRFGFERSFARLDLTESAPLSVSLMLDRNRPRVCVAPLCRLSSKAVGGEAPLRLCMDRLARETGTVQIHYLIDPPFIPLRNLISVM